MLRFLLVCCYAVLVVCGGWVAGQPSLVDTEGLQRKPLVDVDTGPGFTLVVPVARSLPVARKLSLFDRDAPQGLFEPSARPGRYGEGVAGLRRLIAEAEAGMAGYDAVQYGARIKPHRPPTELTIGEIRRWIAMTPGQPHAIGRYQVIPPTFERLVSKLGLTDRDRFSPANQDRMADALLEEAGLTAYVEGTMRQVAFMNNLAKIWAGLPNETGRSHYHGYAGNKAVISWDHFRSEMNRIFPRG